MYCSIFVNTGELELSILFCIFIVNKIENDMQLIELISCLPFPDAAPNLQNPQRLPRMYALSKTGSVRVYEIEVHDMGDHAVMTTRKKVTMNGKWTEDKYEYWTGVNIGKSNETTYLEQALSEAQSAWNRLRDAGFTTTIPNPETRFNTDANGQIKPMLAISFNEKKIKFPCLCQPKYDGVRCTISEDSKGIHIISRKGKPYNIPHLEKWAGEHRNLLPLDGELYNHKDLTFQEIVSAVKRLSDITPKIRYVVYDRPIPDVHNGDRWTQLCSDFADINDAPAYISGFTLCFNMKDIWDYHKECVSQGYEGIIIRNLDAEYEFGFRSSNLIKLKTFDDKEFSIVDVVEATGRDAGTAILVCKCKGGTFSVKPQGTRELRHDYWVNRKSLIGKKVTVQYQGLSDDGVPRFPSAISIRDYE